MERKYRIMIEGEDRSIWCEANGLTYAQAMESGPTYCERYENAQWFVELEEPKLPYYGDEGFEEDYE